LTQQKSYFRYCVLKFFWRFSWSIFISSLSLLHLSYFLLNIFLCTINHTYNSWLRSFSAISITTLISGSIPSKWFFSVFYLYYLLYLCFYFWYMNFLKGSWHFSVRQFNSYFKSR
jgi:hypothetical protein